MPRVRWVLHVDLDQFLAAVEIGRRPWLRDKPVVVGGGGDPTRRGVVATASYRARAFGIRSGMPLRTAARKCPDAVFLPSDPESYTAVSEQVMATLRTFDLPVEVLGWDEAFLGTDGDEPESLARRVQDEVRARTGLDCSIGVGDNKLRAKIATGYAKPAGVFRLTAGNWCAVMGEEPTEALWGIGGKTARKLSDLGLSTVTDLAEADRHVLAERLGPTMGPWYRHLARGHGTSEVVTTAFVPRSRSRETTFQTDLTDWQQVRHEVALLARRVAGDVAAEGRPAVRVVVKVRFAPFHTHTHGSPLPSPTDHAPPGSGGGRRRADQAEVIERAALTVLERFSPDRPVRLLGVRAEFATDGPA